jgi:hypothetical protein
MCFQVRVNGGPEQDMHVRATAYVIAAAAVPAILGYGVDQYPLTVSVSYAGVLPDYGPYVYRIEDPHSPPICVDTGGKSRNHSMRSAT